MGWYTDVYVLGFHVGQQKRRKKTKCRIKCCRTVFLTLPLRFISATLAYTLPVLAGEEGCDLVAWPV